MVRSGKTRKRHPYELTREEGWALFDEQARKCFGMSGAEFLAKYDAGEIDVDDPAIHGNAIHMEMLLPLVREVYPRDRQDTR